ncbi:hypothetical protein BU17DRAFT_55675 [Hysterangium stoloniferum]|nr:hypothetical protein BU17DRAFT_55675 [Hysterangium stoloniferum]
MEYDFTEPPSFPQPLFPAINETSAKEPSERNSIKSKRPRSSTSSISSAPPDYKSKSSSSKIQSDVKFPSLPQSPSKKSRSFSSSSSSTSTATSSNSTGTVTVSRNSERLITSHATLRNATLRTFDDVVDEATTSLALRAKMHAESITLKSSDVIKIGVCTTMSRADDQYFLYTLASKIHHAMSLQNTYLFALFPSMTGNGRVATLVFCGAPQRLVTKASILAGLRFKTRLAELQDQEGTWTGLLEASSGSATWAPLLQDEEVLWDIVRKAVSPINPMEPPAGSRGAAQLVHDARSKLDRLSPREAYNETHEDGVLVDIRPEAQRIEYGSIPGAVIIERNDLEWRFDPRCADDRLPIADRYDLRIIVYCQEGKSSSLAAASLQNIGLWRATDIEGGFSRWENEGLPTHRISYDSSSIASESLHR